ncbi:Ig-like domain-containing protein, partial [Flavobacterium paronense]
TGNYYVSQTVNSCQSLRTAVAVTINTTASPTASAQTFNNSATVANLVAIGTSLQWYSAATSGTALASTTALVTGNYYVSQTVNSCESRRIAVAVTINLAPTASSQTFCTSATVANLVATGASLQWYSVATGGASLASTTALVTGNYYVSQTVNLIESPRTAVVVKVFGAPIAKAISSTTSSGSARSPICIQDIKVLNVKSGYSATTIQWESAVVNLTSNTAPASSAYTTIVGATGPSYTVTNAVAGKNYFRAKFINGDCADTALYSTAVVYYKDCAVAKLSVKGYPNPFNENFNISLSTPNEEKIGLSVYDMTGKLIEQQEVSVSDFSEMKFGDRYPSGIYNVVVSQGDEIKTTRVIKK